MRIEGVQHGGKASHGVDTEIRRCGVRCLTHGSDRKLGPAAMTDDRDETIRSVQRYAGDAVSRSVSPALWQQPVALEPAVGTGNQGSGAGHVLLFVDDEGGDQGSG